jgi:hypothetical protein
MHPNFPGMNPYLENPETWSEVHFWLIAELARMLNPVLAPKFRQEHQRLRRSQLVQSVDPSK